MLDTLSTGDRQKLFLLVSGLSPTEFNALLYSINPPAGIVPPPSSPQGDRVFALLQWLQSPNGLERFDAFLEALELVAPGKFKLERADNSQAPTVSAPSSANADFSLDLGGSVTLEMIYIPGGRFWMGSPENELGRQECEGPQQKVIVEPFFMGKYPVTQRQWRAVSLLDDVERHLSPNPAKFKGDDLPVEQMSWYEALEFCNRLSSHHGYPFRLPSEAEWEYACRAGTDSPFYFGETISTEQANYNGNYVYGKGKEGLFRGEPTVVGHFPANEFGLYDMHGSVWEWCQDVWHHNYQDAPKDARAWIMFGEQERRSLRGGCWDAYPHTCRSASRNSYCVELRDCRIGFRVCSSVKHMS